MAHIQKHEGRPKPYEVRYRFRKEGRTVFRQQSFRTRREADAFRARVEAEASFGGMPDLTAAREPLGSYAARWVDRMHVKERTREGYRQHLRNHVLPAFGDMTLGSIAPSDVEDYVALLAGKGLAPPTIRHAFTPLKRILGVAVRDRILRFNPADGVRLPSDRSVGRHKPEPHFLTEEQVERLVTVLDEHPPYGLLVRFMAYTGLRAGEIAGLDVGDVKLGRIHVHRTRSKVKGGWAVGTPKSDNSTRHVPLPEWLRDDLARYLALEHANPRPDAPLWPGRHRYPDLLTLGELDWAEPWERGCFYKSVFKPALAWAGLPAGVRLHDLRHTYASICASAGIPAYRVSRYMGHANVTTTLSIYTHLFAGDATDDMARLARPSASSVDASSSAPTASVVRTPAGLARHRRELTVGFDLIETGVRRAT